MNYFRITRAQLFKRKFWIFNSVSEWIFVVFTGESELIFDDLIELADENMSANSSLSSAASTPSPVISVQKMQQRGLEPRPLSLSPTTLPYHSRLHEALTQPRLPQQPVKCHRCGLELTSRCLMQTCADDTRCRLCGHDLTTKCILQVCTIPPKESLLQTQSTQSAAPRKRVHHYSTPQWISRLDTSNNGFLSHC